MLLSATLSKPAKKNPAPADFVRVKIKLSVSSNMEQGTYLAEFYTKTQVFHKKMTSREVTEFIQQNVPVNFKSCVERTQTEEITVLANKKGKITRLVKKIPPAPAGVVPAKAVPEQSAGMSRARRRSTEDAVEPAKTVQAPLEGLFKGRTENFSLQAAAGSRCPNSSQNSFNRKKKLYSAGGLPCAFFGAAWNYDGGRQGHCGKIRQIPANQPFSGDFSGLCGRGSQTKRRRGAERCGFWFRQELPYLCGELGLKNLSFAVGDIAEFSEDRSPDIVITLHACDTATDFALNYAVKKGAAGILSVPCCQHEINSQLKKHSSAGEGVFEPLLKYGLIKERFSALVTDALRGELLEQAGYRVQMLEFIDDQGTPKNLMIRAVKKGGGTGKTASAVEEVASGKKLSSVKGAASGKAASAVKGAASDKKTSSVEGGGAKKVPAGFCRNWE